MKVLLIDNFDSFTYNLYQQIVCTLPAVCVTVVRNNEFNGYDIAAWKPDALVISPGPGEPKSAGCSIESVLYALQRDIPLLGVCLGHQAIAEALGGQIVRAPKPVHGIAETILHNNRDMLFQAIGQKFKAMRYHSLIVDPNSVPACIEITAKTLDGLPMALRVKDRRIWGLQFHPESFLSPVGPQIMHNFFQSAFNAKELQSTSTQVY